MTARQLLLYVVVTFVAIFSGRTLLAQQPRPARVQVTVVDSTGGVVPDATVDLIGLEDATRTAVAPTAKTSATGIAVVEGLLPGRYSIRATFPGFDIGLLREIRLRAGGDTRHVVVLPLAVLTDSVSVSQNTQAAAADRQRAAFGLQLADAQIQGLSDDPQELARQIAELAGPDAIVRVDSFEGQQLPPKSQIKSIHVVRDQFAAEAAQPGTTFVDVVTQPGIGAIRGTLNLTRRNDAVTGKSQFTPTRGPEQFSNIGGTIGGALVEGRTSFSANFSRVSATTTPVLNAALPDGTHAETLGLRQPSTSTSTNVIVDHAITREQTLRVGFNSFANNAENLGIGAYDLPERGFTNFGENYNVRVQEAGPIGRRTFLNTRLVWGVQDFGTRSNVNQPTIIVQDAFNSGGAQQGLHIRAKQATLASDLDHVRGIHSWRTGVQLDALWFNSDSTFNLLGTYTFSSLADYQAGTPAFYTKAVGTPYVSYSNWQAAGYVQDDIRVRRGLTLSPGVRYSAQKRIDDWAAFEPRFGLTWAPYASGRTTLRGSAGIFHGFLPPPAIEQTLRQDGEKQKELVIINPLYPDPGIGSGVTPPSNKYVIGDFKLQKNVRYSAGVDQVLSPRVRVSLLYNYIHQQQLARGRNLNAPVNGVRPDPNFANVVELVTDTEIRRHEVFANATFSLAAPSPALQLARVNWRRMNVNASYSFIGAQNNSGGPFVVPPTGNIEDDWGPGPADSPYRVQILLTSTQVRNLQINATYLTFAGFPYNWTTGKDDNQDGFLNDRPANVGLRTLRGTRQENVNLRVGYTFNVGGTQTSAPVAPPARYRMQIFTSITNLLNHQNLGGYSGVETSQFFRKPTSASNLRKLDVGMSLNF